MSICDSCHAGCCRTYAIPVSGADILNIERRLGLAFEQFVCRWPDPYGKIARDSAPQFFFNDAPQTPFVICLSRSQGVFLPQTTKCRFLMEGAPDTEHPLGVARCGIYGVRPSACRVFPTKFNADGDLAVLYGVPAREREGGDPAYDLCPREWEATDLDPLRSVQDLVVAKYEMAFFSQMARAWNESPKSWQVFPEFLHLVYDNRVQRDDPAREYEAEEGPATLPFPTVRLGRTNRRAA